MAEVRSPREPAHMVNSSEQEPREPRASRVLVVDDEPAIARALQRMLKQQYDVVICGGALVAFRKLTEDAEAYRAIVCDLMMPGMSGMDLYFMLQREIPGLERRMVFVTGGACSAEEQAFLDGIENACVAKPISRTILHQALERLVP